MFEASKQKNIYPFFFLYCNFRKGLIHIHSYFGMVVGEENRPLTHMMVWLQQQGLTETNQTNVELPVMFMVLYTL